LEDSDKNDPESRLALVLFRYSLLLDQGGFARAAGIAQSQLSVYELGKRATPREVLEKAATAAGFPVDLLDSLLWMIRSFRVATKGRSRADRVFADGLSAELIVLVRQATDVILQSGAPERPEGNARPDARDRAGAAGLWERLEGCTAAERRMLVEEVEEYQSWALCERVAAESVKEAPNHPRQALELAELALHIAERVPGEEAWRSRVQGYAGLCVSNARHACNDLPGADEALTRARKLWESGAAGDPGLLETAYLLRSPRNAERLWLALDQARRGEGLEMSVEELRREVLDGEGDR
jgi:transcriptional regulator with XRE-family HTH domain